ncbi:twin-arginine translocase TatA/TatE family subunit [Butyricicoccus sp. 1XD8-22]|nr:twin-arginine translocase TatA/TatE family subunit [Butyricicoccus sp. 1XD8-22]
MVVHLNSIGPTAIIIIAVAALLIFGPKKLPELGRAVGTTLREFKKGTKGLIDDDEDDSKKSVIEHKNTTIQQAEVKEPNKDQNVK